MFVLSTVEDVIAAPASAQRLAPYDAIVASINEQYANRAIAGVGLCMCVHDVLSAGVGKVRWGDGKLYYHTQFRLVVFRPAIGEVLVGRISHVDPYGIKVSLGFFDDILIPAAFIPTPRAYDHSESAWFWAPTAAVDEAADDALDPALEGNNEMAALDVPKEERAYLGRGEILRFRVEAEEFPEDEPGAPKSQQEGEPPERQAPYIITVSVPRPPSPSRPSTLLVPLLTDTSGRHLFLRTWKPIMVGERRGSRNRRVDSRSGAWPRVVDSPPSRHPSPLNPKRGVIAPHIVHFCIRPECPCCHIHVVFILYEGQLAGRNKAGQSRKEQVTRAQTDPVYCPG